MGQGTVQVGIYGIEGFCAKEMKGKFVNLLIRLFVYLKNI